MMPPAIGDIGISSAIASGRAYFPWINGTGGSPFERSGTESFDGARFRLRRLFVAISRGRSGLERVKQTGRDARYFIDRSDEHTFIRLRRFVEAADFPHELQRGGTNLFLGYWRLEIEKRFDIPAHCGDLEILENSQAVQKNISRVSLGSREIPNRFVGGGHSAVDIGVGVCGRKKHRFELRRWD